MKNIFRNFFSRIKGNNSAILEEKEEVRTYIHLMKKELTEQKKQSAAEAVFSKIENFEGFKNAQTILFYSSIGNELPTHEYIKKWSAHKQILLPSVKEHEIQIKKYVPKEPMEKGALGILEPKTDYVSNKIDLAILPGIAFDREKNRMGRGKGYYDKYLKKNKIKTIGVGYDFQLMKHIPIHAGDMKMEVVITPTEVVR